MLLAKDADAREERCSHPLLQSSSPSSSSSCISTRFSCCCCWCCCCCFCCYCCCHDCLLEYTFSRCAAYLQCTERKKEKQAQRVWAQWELNLFLFLFFARTVKDDQLGKCVCVSAVLARCFHKSNGSVHFYSFLLVLLLLLLLSVAESGDQWTFLSPYVAWLKNESLTHCTLSSQCNGEKRVKETEKEAQVKKSMTWGNRAYNIDNIYKDTRFPVMQVSFFLLSPSFYCFLCARRPRLSRSFSLLMWIEEVLIQNQH